MMLAPCVLWFCSIVLYYLSRQRQQQNFILYYGFMQQTSFILYVLIIVYKVQILWPTEGEFVTENKHTVCTQQPCHKPEWRVLSIYILHQNFLQILMCNDHDLYSPALVINLIFRMQIFFGTPEWVLWTTLTLWVPLQYARWPLVHIWRSQPVTYAYKMHKIVVAFL